MSPRFLPPAGSLCLLALLLLAAPAPAGDKPKPKDPVELIGTATDYFPVRDWNSYYWRDDFTFLLKDDKSGKTWRILSREPTPAYDWRMGTTFTGLKVDWQAKPRVKIVGVNGIDRQPVEFYKFKLDDPLLATALVVYVETKKDQWQAFYVNNWFHPWGEKADKAIHQLHADKKAPYDIYGFINGQSAPFNKEAKELIAKNKKARMFHGLIRAAKDQPFGYEIDLLHLFGPDAGGNGLVFYGDPKTVPMLDMTKLKKN